MDTYVNIPEPFTGTDEEAAANLATHNFGYEDRCYGCDCRPWGITALYPCGAHPDRYIATTAEASEAYGRVDRVVRLLVAEMIGDPS